MRQEADWERMEISVPRRLFKGLTQNCANVTQPFIEHIHTIRDLYNKPVTYLIDGTNVADNEFLPVREKATEKRTSLC